MSGGIPAIRGFDYQAAVTLELMFEHFEREGEGATIRPEGIDDIDLHLHLASGSGSSFICVQVKKPTEFSDATPNPTPWTLIRAAADLLPDAIKNIKAGASGQRWILGDGPDDDLRALVDAGAEAPTVAKDSYWKVLRHLAMVKAVGEVKVSDTSRRSLTYFRPKGALADAPGEALRQILEAFETHVVELGEKAELSTEFANEANDLHSRLPAILAKISIDTSGTEEEIVERVCQRLESRYSFSRELVERTIFRNLRGFIYEIQKQPKRTFNHNEMETELRCVWPEMVSVKTPPDLRPNHVIRQDLSRRMVSEWSGTILEVVGISGSGKTGLAAEVIKLASIDDPSRTCMYVEVRSDAKLRDVLAGIAFSLRRIGSEDAFHIAVNGHSSNEEAITALSKALSQCGKSVLVVMDLVDGQYDDRLLREFSVFARGFSHSDFRLVVLGQRRAFGALSDAESASLGVVRLEMRGFRFDEFRELVGQIHPEILPGELSPIYERVTVGRPSGLSALLAQMIARASSIDAMKMIVDGPADDILPRAEADRFRALSPAANEAASALVCFALPFSRKDAQEIFPELQVNLAIREMLDIGLLGAYDPDLFEMHEAVRAGLEAILAIGPRRRTHRMLADWYGEKGLKSARIYHLEKAGDGSEALDLAKQSFLCGENWNAISSLVIGRKLVTSAEVVAAFLGVVRIPDAYLFPEILESIGGDVHADDLIAAIRKDPERLNTDHHWMSAIFEVIVRLAPDRLHDLVELLVTLMPRFQHGESVFAWLGIAASRTRPVLDDGMIELFKRQGDDTKRAMLRFLMADWRRATLRHAFAFIATEPSDDRRRSDLLFHGFRLGTKADVAEFLAAIPVPDLAKMMHAKSALLGPFADPIWKERMELRKHCSDLLVSGEEDEVLINAMRVLIQIADPTAGSATVNLLNRRDAVGSFAKLLPAISPLLFDQALYEEIFLDETAEFERRFIALMILASAGSDIGAVRARLNATGEDSLEMWDPFILLAAEQAPFRDAIPILEKALKNGKKLSTPARSLSALGSLPFPEATALLLTALEIPDDKITSIALVQLRERRAKTALRPLVRYFSAHRREMSGCLALTGILASGPQSMAEVETREDDEATVQMWQCVLVARTRDTSFSEKLVRIASDTTCHWQLRRAAISAGGWLPHEDVIAGVAQQIMKERSPLADLDDHRDLQWHSLLTFQALNDAQTMRQLFVGGRMSFVRYMKGALESLEPDALGEAADAKRTEVSEWLFDKLSELNWTAEPIAIDRLISQLHIPILQSAVIRALVRQGEVDKLANFLTHIADPWLATRCAIGLARADKLSGDVRARANSLLEQGPLKSDPYINRIVDDLPRIASIARKNGLRQKPSATAPRSSMITADQALAVLSGTANLDEQNGPLCLETVAAVHLERLVRAADPKNGRSTGVVERYIPSLAFRRSGHVVSHTQMTYSPGAKSIDDRVRGAIAAAHDDPTSIPWHSEGVRSRYSSSYVKAFLESVQSIGDGDKLFAALAEDPEVMLEELCRQAENNWYARPYVDARIISLILRYGRTGSDVFFGGLCALVCNVTTPDVDSALMTLLDRWTGSLNTLESQYRNRENLALWKAFDRLSEHPRFFHIPDWTTKVGQVLAQSPPYYHAEDLVEMLTHDPRAYVGLEARLMKEVDWVHRPDDMIYHLDTKVDRLFGVMLEE